MKYSCYYIICFGCLWALLNTFILFFGINLLTGGPAQIAVFLPISVFRRKGISNGVEMERNQLEKLFLEGNPPNGLGPHVRRYERCSRGWGAPLPPGRAPLPCGAPVAPPTYSFHPYITPRTLKLLERRLDREFRCQKPP